MEKFQIIVGIASIISALLAIISAIIAAIYSFRTKRNRKQISSDMNYIDEIVSSTEIQKQINKSSGDINLTNSQGNTIISNSEIKIIGDNFYKKSQQINNKIEKIKEQPKAQERSIRQAIFILEKRREDFNKELDNLLLINEPTHQEIIDLQTEIRQIEFKLDELQKKLKQDK